MDAVLGACERGHITCTIACITPFDRHKRPHQHAPIAFAPVSTDATQPSQLHHSGEPAVIPLEQHARMPHQSVLEALLGLGVPVSEVVGPHRTRLHHLLTHGLRAVQQPCAVRHHREQLGLSLLRLRHMDVAVFVGDSCV